MVNDKDISIIWFRQDLRIKDNPALSESLKHSVFIQYIYWMMLMLEIIKWGPLVKFGFIIL